MQKVFLYFLLFTSDSNSIHKQQNVIDDAIDQWHRRLRACVLARGGHFEYFL